MVKYVIDQATGNLLMVNMLNSSDSTQATAIWVSHLVYEECIPCILDQIDHFLSQNNQLCDSYRKLRDVQARLCEERLMKQVKKFHQLI